MKWRKRDRTVWDEVLFDQTVPEEHRLRKIDATIDLSFINNVCSAVYADWGRPAEEPEHLFRMYLLMFLENIGDHSKLRAKLPPVLAHWHTDMRLVEE